MLFKSWLSNLHNMFQVRNVNQRRVPAVRFRPRLDVLEDRLAPAVITLTANPDDPWSNGQALQDAIRATNANPGADTIVLGAGHYITDGDRGPAAEGDGRIRDDLTITGAGSAATIIDGNYIERVFEVFGSTVDITGVKITGGGGDGGGLLNHGGTITITNCDFAGGIAGPGDGGAIWNDGTMTIKQTTFSNNSAELGGAIYNVGDLTMNQCTLSGNTATGSGGAIAILAGSLKMNGCTVNGNSAYHYGGGMYVDPAVVSIIASDFSGNTAAGSASCVGASNRLCGA